MQTQAEMEAKATRGWWPRILALTDYFAYPLRTSHYVELVNPLWITHALQARIEKVWDETRDARTLTLRPGLNWHNHRAGQHVRVGIPMGGMHYTRTYTISSPPEREDGCISITVKAIAGGRLSHHIVRNLKVGDYLPVGLPQGDFYLPDAQPVQPLFITGGSGITPAMSMLRSLIAQQRLPDTVHIHYAPHELDVIFGKELQAMAQQHARYHLRPVYTHEYGEQKQTKGYFNAEQLERLCPDWRTREVYACGPPGLAAALDRGFEVLVLTNAMQPLRRHAAGLLALRDRFGIERLTMRVSLDHHEAAHHDLERGEGSFAKAMAGLAWLAPRHRRASSDEAAPAPARHLHARRRGDPRTLGLVGGAGASAGAAQQVDGVDDVRAGAAGESRRCWRLAAAGARRGAAAALPRFADGEL